MFIGADLTWAARRDRSPDLRGLDPRAVERGEVREISRQRGFGMVLLLVFASASLQVAAPVADWSQLLTIALGAAILSVSAWAARAEHALVRVTVVAAILLTLASIVVVLVRGDVPKASAALVSGLLVAFAPVVIAAGVLRDIRSERQVTMRTLSGVLAIYLLLGMFFSFVDTGVAALESGPYFAGDSDPNRSDFLYFSYVTLSTSATATLRPSPRSGGCSPCPSRCSGRSTW